MPKYVDLKQKAKHCRELLTACLSQYNSYV
jgi:hypothetical protein